MNRKRKSLSLLRQRLSWFAHSAENPTGIMFAVIFEVTPDPNRFDAYIDIAKSLRPELEGIVGFIENLRYKSATRPGHLLSLSLWEDEKALVRWRTREKHSAAQGRGRDAIFLDYHLRVGQVIEAGGAQNKQEEIRTSDQERFDETHVGEAKIAVLVDGLHVEPGGDLLGTDALASRFGLDTNEMPPDLVSWDVMDAVIVPGDIILLSSWANEVAADKFSKDIPDGLRYRKVRIIRDYGKYDRREAPQFYKDAHGQETLH